MIEWRPVKGYEGLYEVNSEGDIRSLTHDEIKIPWTHPNGYSFVWLYKDNVKYNARVHRVVAEAFIENPDNKPFIDHINRDRTDNRACNLRWVTKSENMRNPATRLFRAKHIYNGRLASEVAKDNGISLYMYYKRLKAGWPVEEACTKPYIKGNKV